MADVAARVGVSKMTVSRALNSTAPRARGLSEELRQQVLRVCDEMGYVIDENARAFMRKRSGLVAVVVPALDQGNFSDTVGGIVEVLENSGLQMLLGTTHFSPQGEEKLLRTLLMRRPEGVIVTSAARTGPAAELLARSGVPVVETWDLQDDSPYHGVGPSNKQALGDLVVALHERGYRRLAFLGASLESDALWASRRQGFVDAMNKLQLDSSRVLAAGPAPVTMTAGAEGMVQIRERWPDTDAVVCVSDDAAFGALAECQRRGWAVPQDIAIAGFGDAPVGRASYPQISTVAVDAPGIGRQAAQLLLQSLEAIRTGAFLPRLAIAVPGQVELRGST